MASSNLSTKAPTLLTTCIGDRLYVGCGNGALQVYSFDSSGDDGLPGVKLLKTHAISKKAIEQIGILGQSNQIAILSGQYAR